MEKQSLHFLEANCLNIAELHSDGKQNDNDIAQSQCKAKRDKYDDF